MAMHVIDPEGEVTIVLQNPNTTPAIFFVQPFGQVPATEPIRILVSAKHLMLASPYFKSLLTQSKKEAGALRATGSVEIIAEGWDEEAFLILIDIIHYRLHMVPQYMDLVMLAKITVIADYYQCQPLLKFFADMWIYPLKQTLPTEYSRDLMLWVWISWFFQLETEFAISTLIAIERSEVPIENLSLPIPNHIIECMNKIRGATISSIYDRLERREQSFLGKNKCTFECDSVALGALQKQMYSSGLSPRPSPPYYGFSYCKIREALRGFQKVPNDKTHSDSSSFYSNFVTCQNSICSTFDLVFGFPMPVCPVGLKLDTTNPKSTFL